jgi:hypothetical protein
MGLFEYVPSSELLLSVYGEEVGRRGEIPLVLASLRDRSATVNQDRNE